MLGTGGSSGLKSSTACRSAAQPAADTCCRLFQLHLQHVGLPGPGKNFPLFGPGNDFVWKLKALGLLKTS